MSSDGPQYPTYPGEDPDESGRLPGPTPSQGPPPPSPGGDQPPPPPAFGQPRTTNSKATWALILGIVSMVCCGFLAGIPAIIVGRQAQQEIDAASGTQEGRGMATAGFILGIIGTVGSVLYVAFVVAMIATNGFGEGLE